MAFLDNSGDIILDAVLTDTGRARLARGDGSFKITKFAFGDDEIDYTNYDANNASGSAYYDLEILQTPVLEAFTNNTSTMKSKLISLTNNNLLYLPVIQVNNNDPNTQATAAGATYGGETHVLMVDTKTVSELQARSNDFQGIINAAGGEQPSGKHIRCDQGLNTSELSADQAIDPELKETQYIIEIDSRFGKIYDVMSGDTTPINPNFIDDDSVASYYVTQNVGQFVKNAALGATTGNTINSAAQTENESILGPRGTDLRFGILSSTDLVSSNFLFTQIGSTVQDATNTYYFIDSTVKVTGVTTGYRVDIPVRFLKFKQVG